MECHCIEKKLATTDKNVYFKLLCLKINYLPTGDAADNSKA